MKIPIPQSFPNWKSDASKPYASDMVRSRNVRLDELTLSGEIDVQNTLSLTKSESDLVTAIFVDPDHLVSYATKKKSYYIDILTSPTPTGYSPDLAATHNLNPKSTGIVSYPRGINDYNAGPYAGSVTIPTTGDLSVFTAVTGFSRTYTFTDGQQIIAARMKFSYTQSNGHNAINIVVLDSSGNHIVTTPTTVAGAGGSSVADWDYWVLDGTNGCNMNDPAGFTIQVYVSMETGGVNAIVLNNPGIGYAPGDTFTINNSTVGAVLATGHVLTIGAGGAVTSLTLDTSGTKYMHHVNNATTRTSGAGSGLTVDITSVSTDCVFSGSSSFDFMYEVGTSSLVSTANAGLYTISESGGTDSVTALYPGPNPYVYTNGYEVGYPYSNSVFEDNYPVILEFFNDRVMLIGNGNHVHWVDTSSYAVTVPDPTTPEYYLQRLQIPKGSFSIDQFNLPDGYVIQWMDCTPDTVYIGAVKYNPDNHFDQVGKSYVVMWQPGSESSTYYEVNDGECVGKVYNNYLYILTNKGNIFLLYNGISQIQFLTKIYQMPDTYTIQLPHPNGVDIYENKIAWLIPGNKYAPAGIYIFDQSNNNVYHKHSPYYSVGQSNYDIGGNQPQITTGALLYFDGNDADMFFAGIDNIIQSDGSFMGGLFDTLNTQNNTLTDAGYIELGRIKASEVDQFADGYALKYRGAGTIALAQKKYETFGSTTDGTKLGYWGLNVTDPSSFTMTVIPSFMKKGDRITVLDGELAGFSTTIKSITGLTVTIDPVSKYNSWTTMVGNGYFTFLWERLGYTGTFTNATTVTVAAAVAALMAIGDEIEFTAGLNAGYITYISNIAGTTITLQDALNYIGSNYALFNLDKYTYLASYTSPSTDTITVDERSNLPLSSDFVQYKLIMSGAVKLRDFQANVQSNITITNNVSGAISRKKK